MGDRLNKEIGKRIRSARQEGGLTQSELGDHLGITKNAVGRIENGFNALTMKNLFELPGILHRPITYFLGLETSLQTDEEELLLLYRTLPVESRSYVFRFLRGWVEETRDWRGQSSDD